MLNFYCDKPPDSIQINGADYPVRTDFFVWIKILSLIRQLDGTGDEIAAQSNANVIVRIIYLAFETPEKVAQNCSCDDILTAVYQFSKGYNRPSAESAYSSSDDDREIVNFEYDLNYILIAIRNQTGIDLTHKGRKPFHWWDFLLEFETLEERHYISRLMSRRAYKGKDADLIKLREASKIPEEFTRTKSEERNDDKFNSYFT